MRGALPRQIRYPADVGITTSLTLSQLYFKPARLATLPRLTGTSNTAPSARDVYELL